MARNSTERLGGKYDLESTGSDFRTHLSRSPHSSPKHLHMWYYAGFKRGGVSCVTSHRSYTCHVV